LPISADDLLLAFKVALVVAGVAIGTGVVGYLITRSAKSADTSSR
jgi:hypothetical protein